jgi:hypothetical protein
MGKMKEEWLRNQYELQGQNMDNTIDTFKGLLKPIAEELGVGTERKYLSEIIERGNSKNKGVERMKWYKVWKGNEEMFKTTSLGMARDYQKKNGGVIKERHWVVEEWE